MYTSKKKAIRAARELRSNGHEVKVFVHDTLVQHPVDGVVAHRYYTVSAVRPEAQTHELVKFRADGTNRLADAYVVGQIAFPTRDRFQA